MIWVRWPESVYLTGDAKAFRDLTVLYAREERCAREEINAQRREEERRRVEIFERGCEVEVIGE